MNAETEELSKNINKYCEDYSLKISISENELFLRYYESVLRWNPRLHLTTLASPFEFAHRFILEGAYSSKILSPNIHQIWDIGSGAGFPGIPLAILRPDLFVYLVEANRKKAIFLKELIAHLNLTNVVAINQRFQDIPSLSPNSCLTTRALEKLDNHLSDLLLRFSCIDQFLFFGSEFLLSNIPDQQKTPWSVTAYKIPFSEKRYIHTLNRST